MELNIIKKEVFLVDEKYCLLCHKRIITCLFAKKNAAAHAQLNKQLWDVPRRIYSHTLLYLRMANEDGRKYKNLEKARWTVSDHLDVNWKSIIYIQNSTYEVEFKKTQLNDCFVFLVT